MTCRQKIKGNTFEKLCCRLSSNWWGKSFLRVPGSGGWNKNVVTGDIFPVDENGDVDSTFPFSVECKDQECGKDDKDKKKVRKKWELHLLMIGKGPFMRWWGQCERDCPEGKHPLLIFKKNYSPVFVMMRTNVLHTPFESLRVDKEALQRSTYLVVPGFICFTWESFCLIFKPVLPIRES